MPCRLARVLSPKAVGLKAREDAPGLLSQRAKRVSHVAFPAFAVDDRIDHKRQATSKYATR